MSELMKTECVL